jgi:F-type H+-transporting ATPase subunit epsilon
MTNQIQLRIVTPEGIQLQTEVSEFTAPSVQGEFGVLPSHRPLLAGLKTGIVRYMLAGDEIAVAVGPGFVKVQNDEAELLTDHFQKKADVDPVVVREALKEAELHLDTLSADSAEDEKERAIAAARWAAVQLELYGDPPPATIILQHEMKLLGHENYAETLIETGASEAADQEAES